MSDVEPLVERFAAGDRGALDEMVPALYGELKRLARIYLSRERANHTLQPTALVNEAYLQLLKQRQVDWKNRAHFLGVAANVMRRVLLHHAETRDAEKRGGSAERVTIDEALEAIEANTSVDVLDLNHALERLAAFDARQARVVELRVFGGLNIEEAAEVMDVSPATIKREWNVARLWLRKELS